MPVFVRLCVCVCYERSDVMIVAGEDVEDDTWTVSAFHVGVISVWSECCAVYRLLQNGRHFE